MFIVRWGDRIIEPFKYYAETFIIHAQVILSFGFYEKKINRKKGLNES